MILLNQMYILLILFFVSLIGIMVMIGRKHLLIEKGFVFEEKDFVPDGEYFEELKSKIAKSLGKFGFALLVIIIRLYVKISSFIINEYKRMLSKIKDMRAKRSDDGTIKMKIQTENKFLKMVGQYKKKIRKIKEKVKEEENL